MTKIVNLTPHAIHLYLGTGPDIVDPAAQRPDWTIEPSGSVARVQEFAHGRDELNHIPFVTISHTGVTGLPGFDPMGEVRYIVSTIVAVAAIERTDLFVPYRPVRDASGRIVGSRALARLVPLEAKP